MSLPMPLALLAGISFRTTEVEARGFPARILRESICHGEIAPT